jgi:hypothetical protein
MPCKCRSLAQKRLARNLVSYRWSNKENNKTASDCTAPPNPNVKTRTQARIHGLKHELAESREHINLLQVQSSQQQKDLTYLHARLDRSKATLALVNDNLHTKQMELCRTETTLNDSLQELQESHVLALQHQKRIQRQQREKKKLSASVQDLQQQVVSCQFQLSPSLKIGLRSRVTKKGSDSLVSRVGSWPSQHFSPCWFLSALW